MKIGSDIERQAEEPFILLFAVWKAEAGCRKQDVIVKHVKSTKYLAYARQDGAVEATPDYAR